MPSVNHSRREFFMGWQHERCYLCGGAMKYPRPLPERGRFVDATEDHVKPKSHGHERWFNSAFACWLCNQKRGARPPTACMMLYAHEVWSAYMMLNDNANVPPLPMVPIRTGCAPQWIGGGAMALAFERARTARG